MGVWCGRMSNMGVVLFDEHWRRRHLPHSLIWAKVLCLVDIASRNPCRLSEKCKIYTTADEKAGDIVGNLNISVQTVQEQQGSVLLVSPRLGLPSTSL